MYGTGFSLPRVSIDSKKIIYWGILGLFLEVMSLIGGAKVSLFSLPFFVIFIGAIELTGDAVMRICMQPKDYNWSGMSLVIGIAVISIPMMLLTRFTLISALPSFIISTSSIIIISVIKKPLPKLAKLQFSDLLTFFIMVLIVGFASKILAGSFASALSGGEFHAWTDYYFHGITINSFANHLSMIQGDPFLVNSPKIFYHYAPFILSAATIPITGLSGPATATALLLPMGLLVAILGLYSLGVELGGKIVAAISITVILCLPEPSMITKTGFFDFYWLLFTAPGSGYAIGIACAACVVFNRFLMDGCRATGCLSVLLLISLISVRVHMFLLLASPFFYLLLMKYFAKQKKQLYTVSLLLAIATLLGLALYEPANNAWTTYSRQGEFLSWSLSTSPYYTVIHSFVNSHFPIAELVLQLLFILTAVLGIFVIIFPVLDLIRRYFVSQGPNQRSVDVLPLEATGQQEAKNQQTLIEFLPWLLIISFVGLVLFAPASRNGDLSEYKQRAFVLLYPVIVIFSISSAVKIFRHFKLGQRESSPAEYTLLFLSLFFVAGWSFSHNPGMPMLKEMPWASSFFGQKITPGSIEISTFIKAHSKPNDVLAFDRDSSNASLPGGRATELIALTGMPAYISRAGLRKVNGLRRLKILTAVENTNDWGQAKKLLQSNGIRWYVSFNKNNPNFDIKGEHHTLRSFEVTVYDSAAENKEEVVAKTLVPRNTNEAHIMSQFNGFNVLNWGPQETIQGVVPNIQPDGEAGLWIKYSGGTILGEIKVMLDDKPANATIQTPELVTASIPADLFNVSGEKNIYIQQIATGKTILIGKLKVNPKS